MATRLTTYARLTPVSTPTTSNASRSPTTDDAQPTRQTPFDGPTLLPRQGRTLLRAIVTAEGAVAEASLVALRGFDNIALLTDVYTAPKLRGRGLARQNVFALLQQANLNGWVVLTYAQPHGRGQKPTWERLVEFYKSCGFEEETSGLLVYVPT